MLDRNIDKNIRVELETAPAGMRVENNEFIVWDTDSSHIDIYDVRLVLLTDLTGLYKILVFCRAGVKILLSLTQTRSRSTV